MYISPSSHKSEVIKFRVTEMQSDLILKNYRKLGFETLSQYMRFLVKRDIEQSLAHLDNDNVISLHDFKK